MKMIRNVFAAIVLAAVASNVALASAKKIKCDVKGTVKEVTADECKKLQGKEVKADAKAQPAAAGAPATTGKEGTK